MNIFIYYSRFNYLEQPVWISYFSRFSR